ncbi:hypothetical protein V1478_011334 [Vespula squamosa]|uniref:Uncharacterized protein n=1 Tax=Vespula squamosa TaxID=30214 RepID=A0ABD2AGD8_VESSQ
MRIHSIQRIPRTINDIVSVSCIRLDPLKTNITTNHIFETIKRQMVHPIYMDLFRMLIFRRMVISNLSIVQEIPYFMEGTMNKHVIRSWHCYLEGTRLIKHARPS